MQQKENADIIINFYEKDDFIKCNLIICNNTIISKILPKILELKYEINYDNNNLIIFLKDCVEKIKDIDIDIINKNEMYFKNNYYKEIFYILYLYINLV
jgi:hypothetical protein